MSDKLPIPDDSHIINPVYPSTLAFLPSNAEKSTSIAHVTSIGLDETMGSPREIPLPIPGSEPVLLEAAVIPEVSPATLLLDSTSLLDHSTSSSASVSGQSTSSSRLSDSGLSVKKRGYTRPQATLFSKSAEKRDSVMSLGSIAHLQYYFARTGLLDGKGGQFLRKKLEIKVPSDGMQRSSSLGLPSGYSDMTLSPISSTYAASESGTLLDSPTDLTEDVEWNRELAMLPPTVSTYKEMRPAYVPPPPDLTMLRRELTDALEEALKVLKEAEKPGKEAEPQGWYEIQGLHLLDVTTLAIRAAKNYYTAHSQYQRLHSIKSEREIRGELYQVLDILKRMAARNFAGGLRQNEVVSLLTWIVGISELIQTEINQEKREAEERTKWIWRTGNWDGRERERELAFLKSFIDDPDQVPDWTPPTEQSLDQTSSIEPSSFLKYFATGLQLVKLHNLLVATSNRSFEIIKTFHTDTIKPYRRADNLRFWVKAAELRWDIKLSMDVMGVAQNIETGHPNAWKAFDEAILQWCQGVRIELCREWSESENKRSPPRLRIERDIPIVEVAKKEEIMPEPILKNDTPEDLAV